MSLTQTNIIGVGDAGGSGGGSGDVVGPASSTDNAVVRFDGATGKILQNSNVIVSDTGAIYTPGTLAIGDTLIAAGVGIQYDETFTSLVSAVTWYGMNLDIEFNSSADASGNDGVGSQFHTHIATGNAQPFGNLFGGVYTVTHDGTGDTDAMTGFEANVNRTNTAAIAEMTGVRVNAFSQDTGTVGSLKGMVIQNGNTSTGTVSSMSGLEIKEPANGGTITINRGLYIQDQDVGTTNFSILQEGAAQNRFDAIILGAAGSAANPQFSFTSDANTGIYNVSANVLGISSDGVFAASFEQLAGFGTFFKFNDTGLRFRSESGVEYVNLSSGIWDFGPNLSVVKHNQNLQFDTGTAIAAGSYQMGRDADATNQIHFNVPTGSSFEWSVNDVAELVLNASTANFQNNTISTTGNVAVGSVPSTTGSFRVANNVTALAARNAANSGDLSLVAVNGSDLATFGNASGSTLLSGGAQLQTSTSSGFVFVASTTVDWRMNFSSIRTGDWSQTISSKLEDAATRLISMKGQNAFATATGTNLNGGNALIYGGSRGSTSGRRGGVQLGLNGSTTEIMLEAIDVQPSATVPSRVLSLLQDAAITTTQMPTDTGDKVIFLANAAVTPTQNAVGGGIAYAEGGSFKWRSSGGTTIGLGDTSFFGGNVVVGATAAGATAASVLALSNSATAPTTSADLAQLYSADISAGNATLAIFTETAVAADVSLVSTNSLTVFINGTKYKIPLTVV